ncbi:MAG: TolC family protein, partial [Betaproteobacteria bacterium]
ARLRHSGGGADYEASVFLDVLGLITIPLATRAEAKRFEAAKLRASAEALQLALETRKAWFGAVAAEETARYLAQVMQAAEASAELARRMAAVGNWSKLDQAREQVFYAEATAQLARAQQARLAAREQLTRLMGLWGEDAAFGLAERLPDLPPVAREAGDAEAQALAQRLDVQAARRDAEALAESLGLTRATRFIDLLEVGHIREREADEARHSGWGVELRIPIFDFGGARGARAEHLYRQAVNRALETAIQARSEVREAYGAYRTAFDLARHHRDEIVPLRKRISEEVLLRYNGMLSSVFELLADARDQVAAVNAYIEALHAFWVAESDFQAALTARSPGAIGAAQPRATAAVRTGAAAH